MPGKMLLIADDGHFSELRAHGELPDTWWTDTTADTLLDHLEQAPPWIIRCRRDLLAPDEETPDDFLPDRRNRAEFINSLLHGTICYLAVVDRQSHESPAKHIFWYERFRREVKDWAKARHVHLQHVLILVCCNDPPAEHLDELQRLVAGSGDEKLFDTAYVMLEDLEPGRESGQFFNAVHVWPMAVGGLLLKLLHDRYRPQAGPTRAYAWRCYQLLPEITSRDQQKFCSEQFGTLFDHLTANRTADQGWEPARFTKFRPLSATVRRSRVRPPDDYDIFASQTWLKSSAPDRLDQVRAESRWEESLSRAGDSLGRRLSRQAVAEVPAVCTEVVKIWNSVHRDPRFIYAALANHDVIRGPALGSQFQTISAHWNEILTNEQEREQLIHDTDRCAEHLEAAREGYFHVPVRMGVVLVVALLVGYVAMLVFHSLVGSWDHAALVAAAGALGAFAAGLFSANREQAAGKRAKRGFEDHLHKIDQKMIERHECCQNAVESANVFWQQMWARAAANRLKHLLLRAQCIFDHELRYHPGREAKDTTTDRTDMTGEEDAGETSGGTRWRQRSHYLKATQLRYDVRLGDLCHGCEGNELDKFVSEQAETFRSELWLKFCEHYDKGYSGNLPARHLIPALRDYCDRFLSTLLGKARHLAIQQMREGDLDNWGSKLKEILDYQQYFELMSCRILSHQTAPVSMRPLPRLYLRQGFNYAAMRQHLDAATLAEDPEISTYLEELPLVGFLFQELPLQFHVGDEDPPKVTLAPYRPEAPLQQPESAQDQDRKQDEA